MSAAAFTFLTYLWHYLVARLVYDQLVRPVLHGHISIVLLSCCVGGAAFLIGRWSGKHSTGRDSRLAPRERS
jgi:hypothetical protein